LVTGVHEKKFSSFVAVHGKNYSPAEYKHRLQVYADNLEVIARLNKENPEATYGENEWTDLTSSEFAAKKLNQPIHVENQEGKRAFSVGGKPLATPCLRNGIYSPAPVLKKIQRPDSLDWRNTADVVQSVKDQGNCGSCWAFSTVQNIEGVLGVAGKSVGSLSPQYVVDCSNGCSWEMINSKNTTVCNQGCNGGWPWTALSDVAQSTGVPGWDEYKYTGAAGTCKNTDAMKIHAKISGYTCIGLDALNNEDEIADYLFQMGPLSVALNALYAQYYKGGIMDPSNCDTKVLNHAVLLVGYGTDSVSGKKYWIVKNSWAATWGEQGYFRIAYGKGTCGINEAVSSALL
jgi:cathepsin F